MQIREKPKEKWFIIHSEIMIPSPHKRCISYQVAKIKKKWRAKRQYVQKLNNIIEKVTNAPFSHRLFKIYSRIYQKDLENPILLHDQHFLVTDEL